MWLAELLGRERGLDVDFRNAPSTTWVCDPHTKVYSGSLSFLQQDQYCVLGTISTKRL